MTDPLAVFDTVIEFARRAILVLTAVLFGIFLIDWLVRTRRLSPFGPVARFFRGVVDPMLEPVERRVVRAGGLPSAAPWWALVAAAAGGILVLLLLQAARGVVVEAMTYGHSARGLYYLVVEWAAGILQLALIVRVVASWLRLSYSRWVQWSVTLTEWFLRPLRRVLPPFGMIDVSPIVAILGIWIARSVLLQIW